MPGPSRSQAFAFDVGVLGRTSAEVYRAPSPVGATLILAHGAGAPQSHPFMVEMATRLAAHGVDVVTFDFLYAANGRREGRRRMPDRSDVLEATWRAAVASLRARTGLPTARLFAGGKSMGGRILSQVVAGGDALGARGLVFLGYPLHPAGKPASRRDAHLPRIALPMLFVQGSRDALGDAREMRAVVAKLPTAELHVVRGGDHSFSPAPLDPIAAVVASFCERE